MKFDIESVKEIIASADPTLEVPESVIEGLVALHTESTQAANKALEANRNKVRDQLGRLQTRLKAYEEGGISQEMIGAVQRIREQFGDELLSDQEALDKELDQFEAYKKRGDEGASADPTEIERRAQEIAERQRERHRVDLERLSKKYEDRIKDYEGKLTEISTRFDRTQKIHAVKEALKRANITDSEFQGLLTPKFVDMVDVQENDDGKEVMVIDHEPVDEYIGRYAQGDGARFVTMLDSSGADPRRLDDSRGKKALPSKPWGKMTIAEKAALAEQFDEDTLKRFALRETS